MGKTIVAFIVFCVCRTAALTLSKEPITRELSDNNGKDENVPLDGFLSSVYVNVFLFILVILSVTVLRKIFPEFYQPRSYVPDDHGAIERRELPGQEQQKHQHERTEEDYATGEVSHSHAKDAPVSTHRSQ